MQTPLTVGKASLWLAVWSTVLIWSAIHPGAGQYLRGAALAQSQA